jgi:hypothetical protein
MSIGNVFSTWINRVYSVSRWNRIGHHRCIELCTVFHRNVLGFTRCDELYAVCPRDVFNVDW